MNPTFILEGPEAGGKSTLAKQLSYQFDMPIRHFSYPRSEKEKVNMFDMYADFIHSNKGCILDRCWYSEMVYGNVMRDGSRISKAQMHELERLILSQGPVMLIHCTAHVADLWRRFSKRGDDYVPMDFDTIYTLKWKYEALMHNTRHMIPVMRYEYKENL